MANSFASSPRNPKAPTVRGVVNSAGIEVSRRKKRAKTGRPGVMPPVRRLVNAHANPPGAIDWACTRVVLPAHPAVSPQDDNDASNKI